jgi:signal transduction histidine kinase
VIVGDQDLGRHPAPACRGDARVGRTRRLGQGGATPSPPRLLAALVALLCLLAAPLSAQAPALALDGPARDEALRGHLTALLGAEALAPADLLGPDAPAMRPVEGIWPDFGYVAEAIWLRLDLVNGTEVTDWRLHFRENFMQEFAVHVARADGTIDTVYALRPDSPFSARAIPYPEMVAPVSLAPGEAVTVLIRYRSGGSSHLPFAVETLESFSGIATTRVAKGYVFYGMMILLITVALIALALFRNRVFAAYAAYATAALLYIVHGDGVAFQMLWPDWPAFNSMASVVTGTGIIVFGAIYARVFLETPRLHPVMDRALVAVIAAPLLLNAALWVANPQLLKKLLVIFSMVAIVTFAISGIVAARTRFREVRFYVVAWLGVVASAVLLNARHVLGIEISQDAQYDSMRAALVFDAVMMGLAIADRYNTLRRSRRAALDASLAQARENARLAGRLARLGERYQRASALARGRGEILENTVHDLRQPMQGLRLSLARLGDEMAAGGGRREEVRRFEAALAYMERLIETRIAEDEAPAAPAAQPAAGTTEAEAMGAHAVLSSVQAMFAPEAEAAGLELRLRLGAPDRALPAFPLMRVVSNLVSNAIKFTDAGGVLIALRPEGDGLRVEIHDTGPGLSEEEFARARARHARLAKGGEPREGSGLGLAIAGRIARAQGWELGVRPGPRRGTCIALRLPARPARPARAAGAEDAAGAAHVEATRSGAA